MRELIKPPSKLIFTQASMRFLVVCNPIIGSLFFDIHDKLMAKMEGVVSKEPPTHEKGEKAEVTAVFKVLENTSRVSRKNLRSNKNIFIAAQHLISYVRDGKRNSLANVFQALSSDAVFTLAHILVYVQTRLGYGFKPMLSNRLLPSKGCLRMASAVNGLGWPRPLMPGGIVGVVLLSFYRTFNLIYFPSLLAFNTGLAVAVGVSCLMGIPALFKKLYGFVSKQVKKGVRASFKQAQLFRLRKDSVGAKLLKDSFNTRFPHMLLKLWQLDAVDIKTINTSTMAGFSAELFSNGFLSGVIGFAKDYSALLETEYLRGYESEMTQCYEQGLMLAKTKVVCEGTFRRTEEFSARFRGTLHFLNQMLLRDSLADLLLVVHNTVKAILEAQTSDGRSPSFGSLRRAFKGMHKSEAFSAKAFILLKLRKDVQHLTSGVTGVVTFFELRKLHKWRPQAKKRKTASRSTEVAARQVSEARVVQNEDEEISIVQQRFEAFADVEMPPEWEEAAPELTNVDDQSASPAERLLLETFAAKRDLLMMSLLRRSLTKLIGAFTGLFGKLQKIVQRVKGQERIQPCRLAERNLCLNEDAASNTRLTVFQVMMAAHLGVSAGPNGHVATSPKALAEDFMSFIKETAWFQYQSPIRRLFRRNKVWGLDLLINYVFPECKEAQSTDKPITDQQLALLERAVAANYAASSANVQNRYEFTRLQCIDEGKLFVLTTDTGQTKIFRPDSDISSIIKKQLCTYEHEFVNFSGWYKQNDAGGQLSVPDIADINGFMTDSQDILRSKQKDENVGYLIEAVLWSKGVHRHDARMASDMMVATKRMLYSGLSWEEFFSKVTPADVDYVQHRLSSSVRSNSTTYIEQESRSLYSISLTTENLLGIVAAALESTIIAAGSLRSGLHDLSLLATGNLALKAINMAEKNVTGDTSTLGKFQVILWEEYATKKQCAAERPVSPHNQTLESARPHRRRMREGTSRASISDVFALEEGSNEPVFDDWCKELYNNAKTSLSEPGIADLRAGDAGVIQCSLLRFLGKRHVGTPQIKDKNAVFMYLQQVTYQLRKAKKTNKYKWETYLNARPKRIGEEHQQSSSVLSTIKRFFTRMQRKVVNRIKLVPHAIRSAAGKRFAGRRVFNILRGSEFLKVLQIAAIETFSDPTLFPISVLVHPTAFVAFSRLITLLTYEVRPLMGRTEELEIAAQMKILPAPSPAVKRLITKLAARLNSLNDADSAYFRQYARRCTGYLSLLHFSHALSGLIGPTLSTVFSRFALIISRKSSADKGKHSVTERELGYMEQASLKIILKAEVALRLLEEATKEPFAEGSFGLMSNGSPANFPLAAANRELRRPQLVRASMLLFCKLVIPVTDHPQHQQRRVAGLTQLKELLKLVTTSKFPVYFQPNAEETTDNLAFQSLEGLLEKAKNVEVKNESELPPEMTAAFMLHASLMKGLEIIGLAKESVGDEFVASPLLCTPEGRSSGVWYTTPVNMQSRLSMIAHTLLQLADTEDVIAFFDTPGVASAQSTSVSSADLKNTTKTESEKPKTDRKPPKQNEQRGPKSEAADGNATPTQAPSDEGPSQQEMNQKAGLGHKQPESQRRGGNEARRPADDRNKRSSKAIPKLSKAGQTEHEGKDGGMSSFRKDTEIDIQSFQNAQEMEKHLMRQLSVLDAHAKAFGLVFHMLLSVAQLPSNLYDQITNRFANYLSVATIGEPRKRRKPLSQRMMRKVHKVLRRPFRTREPAAESQNNTGVSEANKQSNLFSPAFLPVSMESAMEKIRTASKRMMRADNLYIRSSACAQDASLWRQDEIEANAGEATRAAAREQHIPDAAITAQVEHDYNGRKELCYHPVWLDLHARVALEQEMLREQGLFSYFIRMGAENAYLVLKTAKQALFDELWNKLIDVGWVRTNVTPQMASAALEKVRIATKEVSKRQPMLAVDPVREMVLTTIEDVMQTPSLTREGLETKMDLLQSRAIKKVAAFILSKTAGVEISKVEEELAHLEEFRPASSQNTSHSRRQTEKPGLQSNAALQAWLLQAYFVADSFMLLSRPSAFTPAILLLDILHQVTHPKTPIVAFWRKAKRRLRGMAHTSLELFLHLPRAYIYYPYTTFYRGRTGLS